MFANLGINLDPKNPAGKPPIADLGRFGWIRVVARRDQEVTDYVNEARQAGIRVLAVLALQSFQSDNPDATEMTEIARAYANQFEADCWQLGNEPDAGWSPTASDEENSAAVRGPHHPSSWCLDPPQFARLVKTCAAAIREVRPTATIITAGLTSGSPEYLARCGQVPVDGVAVHPYGQRPEPDRDAWKNLPGNFGFVGNLLGAYGMFGRPLWVTEVGVSTTEASRALQARYCEAMMSLLRDRADVSAGFWFCYSDGMVPEFGLIDKNGAKKPAFSRFPT
jgi:hypothetical protein